MALGEVALPISYGYGPPVAKLMLGEPDFLDAGSRWLPLFKELEKGVCVSCPLHVDCPEIERPRMRVDTLSGQVTNPALSLSTHPVRSSVQRYRLLMAEAPRLKKLALNVRFCP